MKDLSSKVSMFLKIKLELEISMKWSWLSIWTLSKSFSTKQSKLHSKVSYHISSIWKAYPLMNELFFTYEFMIESWNENREYRIP